MHFFSRQFNPCTTNIEIEIVVCFLARLFSVYLTANSPFLILSQGQGHWIQNEAIGSNIILCNIT
jgi:hypothetical protein